jgi:CRP/FNR family cyclic AMP-dependent transcriptional regulator
MADLADVLASTPLCRDLTRDEVERIADEGRVERWAAGSLVLEEGSVGPRIVVLLEGKVSISKRDANGQDHVIAEMGPGAVLGEMSLLLHQPHSATVRALDALRLFAMERSAFEEMVAGGDPAALKMGVALGRAVAGRLTEQNGRIVGLLEEIADHRKRADFLREQNALQWKWDF